MSSVLELSKLEPAAFEHLVNALVLKVLGAGATSFCPGADAGRDGWFEGEANYPSDVTRWKGLWYIQSKFHAPNLSKNSQKWLLDQIRAEIKAFSDPESERKWPDNWIIATNVDPSANAETGTFDLARSLVAKARPRLAKRFHIWGGQKLINYLSDHHKVAERFGHFLTPGHVISALYENLSLDRTSVEELIKYTVGRGVEDQRFTKLEQAGSSEDRRPGIEALFVDLPFSTAISGSQERALSVMSGAAAQCHKLDPDFLPDEKWASWKTLPCRASVWFVRAGPGRGKSSIGQFFCQIHRAALILQGDVAVHPELVALAERIKAKAVELSCWPSVPRIPLWVELRIYAAWYQSQNSHAPKGIASYLSSQMHKDAEVSVDVKLLRKALSQRSWIIVFDGLDEVPSDVKDKIASEVVSFVKNTALNADIFSICSSRPQGYSGQFDSLDGAVVDLIDLPPQLAIECASKVAVIGRNTAEAEKAKALLKSAMDSPAVRELLTTPLQAHIMAVLVRNGQRPPERKWDLYKRFYEVIRDREANRDLPDSLLRDLFQRDSALIDTVHQRLGFALHARAEEAKGADTSLTKEEFRLLIEDVIEEIKGKDKVASITNALLQATTERLVLISTPDQGDRVRFDIRAIQEFFAGEFIYLDTPASRLQERLELIAGDAHWREVVQFVLGAITALRRATEWAVAIEVLRSLDGVNTLTPEVALTRRLARGALHAALFLSNGAAEASQKTRDQLHSILDPVLDTSDENLIATVASVTAPESRKWLIEWARSQLRRLRSKDSAGALKVLALLTPPQASQATDFLDCLSNIETYQITNLLSSLRRSRLVGRHETHDQLLDGWDQHAAALVLERGDCLAAAPSLVSSALTDAFWNSSQRFTRSNIRRNRLPKGTTLRILEKLFAPSVVQELGFVSIEESKLNNRAKALFASETQGLLGWLNLVLQLSAKPSIAKTVSVLEKLGDSWSPVDALPKELRTSIPLPADRRVSPKMVLSAIQDLTDSALQKAIDAGFLQQVGALESNSGAKFFIRSFRATPDGMKSFAEGISRAPEIAWMIWCSEVAEGAESALTNTKSGKSEAAILDDVRSQLADFLCSRPYAVHKGVTSYFLSGLAALESHQHRALTALRNANIRWSLSFTERVSTINIPAIQNDEARWLPLITSAYISSAIQNLSRSELPFGLKAKFNFVWKDISRLVGIYSSAAFTSHERGAAVLLVGLSGSEGSWDLVLQQRSLLVECARDEVPVSAGIAFIMEVTGAWQDREARELLGELLALDGTSSCRNNGSSLVLDTIFKVWRERSVAPLTRAGETNHWLGLRAQIPLFG